MNRLSSKIGMVICGPIASEAIDSQAEKLDIDGTDVSDWEKGTMYLNWDHVGDKEKLHSAKDFVGKVIYAKKIFVESDCENKWQKAAWDKLKLPFIWAVMRLFDGSNHENAKALAAIIRDNHANNDPSIIGASVEGTCLERSGQELKTTVVRKVAITTKPANKTCMLEMVYDPNAPEGMEEFGHDESKDLLKDIAKEISKSIDNLKEEYEPLSKQERDFAKKSIKALVAQKILEKPDGLQLFERLLPLYLENGKQRSVSRLDDTALAFVQKTKAAPITINFSPTRIKRMIQEGRFKNQFENASDFDRSDLNERKQFEAQVFGLPLNTAYRSRPIYGALHLEASNPECLYEGGAPMYGTAFFVLNNDVKKRATFTHNDSFLVTSKDVMPLKYLDKVALNYVQSEHKDIIEAQIYGGLDFYNDIESLHVPQGIFDSDATSFGEKFGVPVYCYDDWGNQSVLYTPGLVKTTTAGVGNVAPSQMMGGVSLQVEDLGPNDPKKKKKKIQDLVYTAFAKTGLEKTKENIKAFIKANLPDIDDDFIDFFEDVVDDLDISQKTIRKMEYIVIEVQKALHSIEKPQNNSTTSIEFNGKTVRPGKALVNGNLHYLVDETPDHYVGIKHDLSINKDNLVKLPKADAGEKYQLHSPVVKLNEKHVLDSGIHGVFPFNHTSDQHSLVDGLDIDSQSDNYSQNPGSNDKVYWSDHKQHGPVFIKGTSLFNLSPNFPETHRELAYHNLANSFFGLGDNLPKMAAFQHPETGELHSIQKLIPNARHSDMAPDAWKETLSHNIANGNLDKMLFMDHVLGNVDRHKHNYMFSPKDKKIHLIDHALAFMHPAHSDLANEPKSKQVEPTYLQNNTHPNAIKWAQNLDRNVLYKQLLFNKVPNGKVQEVMNRFDHAKDHIVQNKPGKVH